MKQRSKRFEGQRLLHQPKKYHFLSLGIHLVVGYIIYKFGQTDYYQLAVVMTSKLPPDGYTL